MSHYHESGPAGRRFLRAAIALLVSSAAWPSGAGEATTQPIVDASGREVPGSIASLERVSLNGVEQTILLRGRSSRNPVLLILHGGPGNDLIGWRELFVTPELEQHFVVVLWAQRGAGKSFDRSLRRHDMAPERFVADTLALTNLLRRRFGQERILLLGHSWGSALGFLTLMRPESRHLYSAYIAAGEAVSWDRRQALSFEWTLQQARAADDIRAIRQLERVMPFDPRDLDAIGVKNRWLGTFGGEYGSQEVYQRYRGFLGSAAAPEYTRADFRNWVRGIRWSSRTTGVAAAQSGYDLFRDLPALDIPVFYFVGRRDWQTPAMLVEQYAEHLRAPTVEVIWFEESAHSMILAEPDKLAHELIRIGAAVLRDS